MSYLCIEDDVVVDVVVLAAGGGVLGSPVVLLDDDVDGAGVLDPTGGLLGSSFRGNAEDVVLLSKI